jgi:hypothetical protein
MRFLKSQSGPSSPGTSGRLEGTASQETQNVSQALQDAQWGECCHLDCMLNRQTDGLRGRRGVRNGRHSLEAKGQRTPQAAQEELYEQQDSGAEHFACRISSHLSLERS